MTYDHWKTTNPADEFLGPEPEEHEVTKTVSSFQRATTYDFKSWHLAGHFLDDFIPESDARRADAQHHFACHIQRSVEEWLETHAPEGTFK